MTATYSLVGFEVVDQDRKISEKDGTLDISPEAIQGEIIPRTIDWSR